MAAEPREGMSHSLQLVCKIETWHDKNIFSGKIITEVGDEVEETSATFLGYENIDDALSFNRVPRTSSKFSHVLGFEYETEDGRGQSTRSIITLGSDIGVPLGVFLLDNLELYQFYGKRNYLRAGEVFRDLFRGIASLLYSSHKKKEYVGKDLRRSLFVKQIEDGYLISVVDGADLLTTELGIWEDLQNLKGAIEWIKQIKPPRRRNTKLVDFDCFDQLYPPIQPESNCIELSYFICHAPLFWGQKQRYSFSSTYYNIRMNSKQNFDAVIELDHPQLTEDWRKKVKDNDLATVLEFKVKKRNAPQSTTEEVNDDKFPYRSKQSIICFHRNAFVHCEKDLRKKASKSQASRTVPNILEVDKKLLIQFPSAMPIAYRDVFRCLRTKLPLVDLFRSGPPGLDYSEDWCKYG